MSRPSKIYSIPLLIGLLVFTLQHASASTQFKYSSYVNKEYAFSVNLPSEWTSEIKSQSLIFSGYPGTEQWQTTINFQIIKLGSHNLSSLVDDLKSQWQTFDPSYRLVSNQPGSLDGHKAKRLLVEYRDSGQQRIIRQEQFAVQYPDYFYLIGYTAPVDLFEKYHDAMSMALKTFHVFKPGMPMSDAKEGVERAKNMQERLMHFIQSVQVFREQNATDGISGWKRFADPQLMPYIKAMDSEIWPEGNAADGWNYFFMLSMSNIGKLTDAVPVVGFYHPWSDVWLVTEWQTVPDPKIISVEMLLGEWVRNHGEPPFDLIPAWQRGNEYKPAALVSSIIKSQKAFDNTVHGEQSWQKVLNLSASSSILEEINYPAVSRALLFGLIRAVDLTQIDSPMYMPKGLTDAGDAFLAAGEKGQISRVVGSATGTDKVTVGALQAMTPGMFESMNPVYWTADDKWATLYFVPSSNTDYFLSLRYQRGSLELQLKRVDLYYFPEVMGKFRQMDLK